MDQSAPHDEFITTGGRPAGPEETPVPEFSVPGTSKALQQHPNENGAHIVDQDGTKKSVGEATQQVEGGYEESRDRAYQTGTEAVYKAQDYADKDSPQEAEEKKMGMREKMRQMGVSLIFVLYPRIYLPLAMQNNVRVRWSLVGGTLLTCLVIFRKVSRIAFLNNARTMQTICWSAADICSLRSTSQLSVEINLFSVERRCAIYLLVVSTKINVTPLSQVVIECQKRDDYQQAIRWFLDHFRQYTDKYYHDLTQTGEQYIRGASAVFVFFSSSSLAFKPWYQESNLELAMAELRTLLERFANYKSLDIVIDAINALIDDTRRDESLREWFKSVEVFIRKVFSPLRHYIYVLIRCLNRFSSTLGSYWNLHATMKEIVCVIQENISMMTSTAIISTTCLTALVTGLWLWVKIRYDITSQTHSCGLLFLFA